MNQERAWVLIEAGYSVAELAEALQVSGQTARGYIRRDRTARTIAGLAPAKRSRGGWSWTEGLSLTQRWSDGMGSR